MKGRCAIRGCSQLESESENKRRKVSSSSSSSSGLCSLPDAVALSCLAHVSKFDLLALGIASKIHRSLVVSRELWDLRSEMGCIEPSVYVCLRISPERNPRWFILHPEQRRLKPLPWNNNLPDSSSSFVTVGRGVYVIGGLVNGEPTSDVSYFDCYERTVCSMPPMKMARASASASLIDGKIYVFGGLRDGSGSDSSNWAEVYDIQTKTWDLLSVSTPKMSLNIQHSVVIDEDEEKKVFAVDKDGQDMSFSPSKSVFSTDGIFEPNPGCRDEWCVFDDGVFGSVLFRRGSGGRILWAFPCQLKWREVQYQKLRPNLVNYGITKLCLNSAGNIVIFWNAQPQGPGSFELWSAEISFDIRKIYLAEDFTTYEMCGEFVWFAPVLKPAPHRFEVLFAGSVYT